MAYITASPNPVGVYSANFGAYASFVWDVQDGPNEMRMSEVVLSINGGPSVPVAGPGIFGRFVYYVDLPNTYEFILRYADTKSELTRVEVQTFDLRTELATGFASQVIQLGGGKFRRLAPAGSGSQGKDAAPLLFVIDGEGQLYVREDDDGDGRIEDEETGPKD
jgi:hypothetical protein